LVLPLLRSLVVVDGDTRFFGDPYQDLSEKARKKFALLQTPVFVEEFILDRTGLAPGFFGRALGAGLEPGGQALDDVCGPADIVMNATAAESWSSRNLSSRGSRSRKASACDSVRVPLRNAAKKAGSIVVVGGGGGAIKIP